MAITIVGLGPGNPAQLTLEADAILRSADMVYVRTGRHPTVDHLRAAGIPVHTFDDVYEQKEQLPQVYAEIAERLLALERERDPGAPLVFAVPGHPRVGDTTVGLILRRAAEEGRAARVVDGLSFVEPTLTLLGIDLLDGVQIVDGLDLILRPFPALDTERAALIAQVYSRQVASDVKLALGAQYPDEHPIAVVRAAGTSEQELRRVPLWQLDHQPGIDHLTSVYLPALPAGSWLGLRNIVARLRAPGGCPWDREQTHQTLRTHLLDETYEVLDALDRDDPEELREELGDLALQIALHIQIAVETGEFTGTDVFAGIIAKLRRRHPHVFGDVEVSGAGEVLVNWEQIKRKERGEQSHRRQLAGVPANLPALSQALSYQQRAERVGYRVEDGRALDELAAEWQEADGAPPDEERLGELLFQVVASARRRGIDPESALRAANARFADRFVAEQEASQKEARDAREAAEAGEGS